MDLEGIMLSEIMERQVLYDISYMWNLKIYKDIIKEMQTHRCKEQTDGYQWRRGNIGVGK